MEKEMEYTETYLSLSHGTAIADVGNGKIK